MRLKIELETIYPGKKIGIYSSKEGGNTAWKGAAKVAQNINIFQNLKI